MQTMMMQGMSKSVFQQMLGIECKMTALKCTEKTASVGSTPACNAGMTSWNSEECNKAAETGSLSGAKATTCCPFGAAIVKCMTAECMNAQAAALSIQVGVLTGEAKAEAQKNLKRS